MNSWCIFSPCSRFSQIWAVWRFEERISGSLLRSAESSVANRRNVNFIRTCHLKKSIKSVVYNTREDYKVEQWCEANSNFKWNLQQFYFYWTHAHSWTLTHEDTNTITTICQCKWRHPMAKFPTIARSAPWWPNSYYCKWHHLVAKFLTNASGAKWPNIQLMLVPSGNVGQNYKQ